MLFGIAFGVLACALAAGYLASLFIGNGRTPYDYAAATHVGPLTRGGNVQRDPRRA
jgi:ABC-type transporter Mla subunit MlaD